MKKIYFACVIVLLFMTSFASAAPIPEHPRMFVASGDLDAYRDLVAEPGFHRNMFLEIKKHADTWLKEDWSSGWSDAIWPFAQPDPSYFRTHARHLTALAFTYLITQEQKYLDRSKVYMDTLATWEYWGDDFHLNGRDLGLSWMIMGYSLAYDWLYNDLSETEQTKYRKALYKFTDQQYVAAASDWNNSWGNWWGSAFNQNHCTTNNSALGVASLVLLGEPVEPDSTPDEEPQNNPARWIDHVTGIMAQDRDHLNALSDGSWHEGVQYQNSKLGFSIAFWYNMQRVSGKNLFPDDYLKKFVTYRLYSHLPKSKQTALPFSTYGPNAGVNEWRQTSLLRFLANKFDLENAQWLADQTDDQFILCRDDEIIWSIFEFFYCDPTVPSTPPGNELPGSLTLTNLEGVIWRTGWENDDLVFALKSGAYGGRYLYNKSLAATPYIPNTLNYGHNHLDSGGFYLYRGSTDLSSEVVESGYIWANTRYHNTVMVDYDGSDIIYDRTPGSSSSFKMYAGDQWFDPEEYSYENTDGKLEMVINSDHFNYVSTDLTNKYRKFEGVRQEPGRYYLKEFTRHVMFVRPDSFVLIDQIASDVLHHYDWLCHVPATNDVTKENDGWIKSADANGHDTLGIKVLSPLNYRQSIQIIGENTSKKSLFISPPEDVKNTRFITVLFPARDNWDKRPEAVLLGNSEKAAGVRVIRDDTRDILINYSKVDQTVVIGDYLFTGKSAAVVKTNTGDLSRIFLGNGSLIHDTGNQRVLIQSLMGRSVTLEAQYGNLSLNLDSELSEAELYGVMVYAEGVESENVTLNGNPIDVFKNENYISLGIKPVSTPKNLTILR